MSLGIVDLVEQDLERALSLVQMHGHSVFHLFQFIKLGFRP
jgi:hypothetical protein